MQLFVHECSGVGLPPSRCSLMESCSLQFNLILRHSTRRQQGINTYNAIIIHGSWIVVLLM